MNETGQHDSVRVSSDGIRVRKRFAADEFPVPAIAFDISSGRDQSVTLRFSDSVPDDVSVDSLGFHPDYGSEHWTIEPERITFEREFEPDGTYTTVYGIRAPDDVEQFLSEPTIESVDPPLPQESGPDGAVLESDDALVENAIAGEIGSPPTDETTVTTPEPESTLDLDGGGQARAEGPMPLDSTADSPDTNQTTGLSDPGSIAAALATELREDNVSRTDLNLLRNALAPDETDNGTDGSTVARLDQLQRDIADLRAYASALEDFLDENGTAQQIRDDVDALTADLDAFEERVDALEADFTSDVRDRIGALEESLAAVDTRVDDQLGQADELQTHVDDLDAQVDSVDDRLGDIVEWADDAETHIKQLVEQTETTADRVAAADERAEAAETRANTAVERASAATDSAAELDTRLEELTEQVDDIVDRVEELEDWVSAVEAGVRSS